MSIRLTPVFLSVFINQGYSIEFVYYDITCPFLSDIYICTVPADCDAMVLTVLDSVLSSLRSVVPTLRLVPDSDIFVSDVSISPSNSDILKVVLWSL